MKVTKTKLIQIIQEELNNVINERPESYAALKEVEWLRRGWRQLTGGDETPEEEAAWAAARENPGVAVFPDDVDVTKDPEYAQMKADKEAQQVLDVAKGLFSGGVPPKKKKPAKKKGTGPSTGSPAVRKHKAMYVKAWKALKKAAVEDPKAGGDWKKLGYNHPKRQAVRDAKERLDNTKKIEKGRQSALARRKSEKEKKARGSAAIRGTSMGKKLAAKGELEDPGERVVRKDPGQELKKRPTMADYYAAAGREKEEEPVKESTITEDVLKQIIKEELGN